MKTVQITLALAAMSLTGAAMADVTLYGIITGDVDTGNNGKQGTSVIYQDVGTRIGFKGTDKWDGGAKTIWEVESGALTGSSGQWGSREAWIGVQDDTWGTLRSGRGKSRYDLIVEEFDTFESNVTMASTFDDATYVTRNTGAVMYTSPSLGGLTLDGEYNFVSGGNHDYTAIGAAHFKQSAFQLYGAYILQSHKVRTGLADVTDFTGTTSADGDLQAYMLGGQWYPTDSAFVGLLYQHATQDTTDPRGAFKRDSTMLMAQYSVGVWTPRAGWVHQFEGKFDNGGKIKTADQFEIGTDYNLSKHSILYAEAAYINNNDQNGFVTTSGTTGWTPTQPGNGKVLSIGLLAFF
ncbi:porin [Silvimonas sp.]|uniref:porin n=1 Tax=Silvimonas sp. TaxID=2650811 RepID=UPI00284F1E46|nr:porin [Silvimonas sp.]MDR3430038.1 porin [Silvimonas sp.]